LYKIFLIGFGGFFGAIFRYIISGSVQKWAKSIYFPYGTLAVNLIGCFVIGFLSCLMETRGFFSAELRSLIFIGILGAFTTFSTFSYETMNLINNGENLLAVANMGIHLVLGLASVWIGHILAYQIWR